MANENQLHKLWQFGQPIMAVSRDSLSVCILHFPWPNLYDTGRSRAQVLIMLKYSNEITVGNKVVAVSLCFTSLSDLGEH